MATIYIDDKPHEVADGQNLLHACLQLKLDLPYFCWHPAMGSVGACRQCAVKQFKDENDTKGKIVMACMTPATNGTRISLDDPEAKNFRRQVTEWLMVNHPHDCPVCDEGGECHLQDMTYMTGHTYRRYQGSKRTFRNQDLGPFVNHEMNRCIQCYRCVRFYRNYAGGRDLDAYALRHVVFFGRQTDGVLENEFAGNLVEICPTGVFTDKSLKEHYTRKWDLQTAPSVCVHCGLGCNTIPGERYATLRRIRNRYNGEVNGYFLCDRGRYGYEFVNSDQRVLQPVINSPQPGSLSQEAEPLLTENVVKYVASLVQESNAVIGIGSPRASLEDNFALQVLVGKENFYQGVSERETSLVGIMLRLLQTGPVRTPSLREVEKSDAVLVLGEDVTNVAPVLALALRQSIRRQPMKIAQKLKIAEWDDAAVREAVQDQSGPLYLATPYETKLDEVATRTYRAAPDDIARLAYAIAQSIDPNAANMEDLSGPDTSLANEIAQILMKAERPLVIAGASCGSEAIIQAAGQVASGLQGAGKDARLCFTAPECNSFGAGLLGGASLDEAFGAIRSHKDTTVIILENDLYRRADAAQVDKTLESAKHVIVLDHLASRTSQRAKVVLPAGTFAESDGTLVNNEGRAQMYFQVFQAQGEVQEAWRWLRDIMLAASRPEAKGWLSVGDVRKSLVATQPVFAPILEIAPPAGFRVQGQKIPREPHRYSGRTAMDAHISVFEPEPEEDVDTPLAFSMEGYDGQPPSSLIPRFWAPGWNSVQSVNKFQAEINGPLIGGDPGKRLIEPSSAKAQPSPNEIPKAFARRKGQWLALPRFHIFGSDELSVLTPGVAQLSPKPYVALGADDAAELGAASGDLLNLAAESGSYRLPLQIMLSLPAGVAVVPLGVPGMPTLNLPAFVTLTKETA